MPAWIEPGTLSLCLYCSTLLLNGKAGMRVLSRHLRHGKETVTGIALDEFSDFLCDHPDALLTILMCSLLAGPRCRLVSRAPALLRTAKARATKTLPRVQLLHFPRGSDPVSPRSRSAKSKSAKSKSAESANPLNIQQAQAKPFQSGSICVHPLPANALWIPALLLNKG